MAGREAELSDYASLIRPTFIHFRISGPPGGASWRRPGRRSCGYPGFAGDFRAVACDRWCVCSAQRCAAKGSGVEGREAEMSDYASLIRPTFIHFRISGPPGDGSWRRAGRRHSGCPGYAGDFPVAACDRWCVSLRRGCAAKGSGVEGREAELSDYASLIRPTFMHFRISGPPGDASGARGFADNFSLGLAGVCTFSYARRRRHPEAGRG